jgi:hypothetical protein
MNSPKFQVGDTVKWQNQDYKVDLIANGQYKLKSLKGMPSTWVSVNVIDSRSEDSKIEEELHEGEFCPQCLAEYITECWNQPIEEAQYKGRTVPLGKPMAGDV